MRETVGAHVGESADAHSPKHRRHPVGEPTPYRYLHGISRHHFLAGRRSPDNRCGQIIHARLQARLDRHGEHGVRTRDLQLQFRAFLSALERLTPHGTHRDRRTRIGCTGTDASCHKHNCGGENHTQHGIQLHLTIALCYAICQHAILSLCWKYIKFHFASHIEMRMLLSFFA